MKRSNGFSIFFMGIFFLSVTPSFAQEGSEGPILTGAITIERIEKNADYSWFSKAYDEYVPDNHMVVALDTMPPSFSFVVFGGTWCDDTHKLLPAFYKTIDMAGIPRNKVTLYFLDREKTSPGGFEKRYDVEFIPTFIVMENGKEKGRIVETVEKSIESDLLKILTK